MRITVLVWVLLVLAVLWGTLFVLAGQVE